MQDKNIAISELKKLIEKCKGKSVETQFDKPSVVRQPNAQRIPKPSIVLLILLLLTLEDKAHEGKSQAVVHCSSRTKGQIYDNSEPLLPKSKMLFLQQRRQIRHFKVDSLPSLLEEYTESDPVHGHAKVPRNCSKQRDGVATDPENVYVHAHGEMIIKLSGYERIRYDEKIKLILGSSSDFRSYQHTSLFQIYQHMDVEKRHFLMVTEEEVYVAQPKGFVDPDHPEKVYLLRKALYGLKASSMSSCDDEL
ncbi:retrovirus-related pol polyprotein from transposon TNT 1-94 [Tanacetum coccineum]